MNENMKPFREWLLMNYETVSAVYRRDMAVVVNTCRSYAEGNIWEPRHTKAGIECLPAIPIIGKYQGEVTEEDKAWYAAERKPDFMGMKAEAELEIEKLETPVGIAPVETMLTVPASNAGD